MVPLCWRGRRSLDRRYSEPKSFGLLNDGQALVVIFTAFAALGMGDIAVRDIMRTSECEQEIMASAVLLQVFDMIDYRFQAHIIMRPKRGAYR